MSNFIVQHRKNIVVLPYDPKWKIGFEEIKRELVKVIGDLTLCIDIIKYKSPCIQELYSLCGLL